MKMFKEMLLVFIICFQQIAFSVAAVHSDKIIFNGISESGITQNSFLCGKQGVGTVSSAKGGTNFEAVDCDYTEIQGAVGFDISKGHTLQFFNNFTYWLRKKGDREQDIKSGDTNSTGGSLTTAEVTAKMDSEGWGSIGAFCIIISTNPTLQKSVLPDKQPEKGETKLIVQLWYNGNDLIQLWSQDVVMIKQGQNFTIAISNGEDSNLEAILVDKDQSSYMKAVVGLMQPINRNSQAYQQAANSPRMVRINVA